MNNLLGAIALIGNPNSGKTALFNALTGLNHKVSNYPGVTVERKTGSCTIGDDTVEIIDLPGTYSLVPESQDEVIVAMEVESWMESDHAPACIISVVDATNLERNLYLTSQLLDLGIPVIVALNMMHTIAPHYSRSPCLGSKSLSRAPRVRCDGSVIHCDTICNCRRL